MMRDVVRWGIIAVAALVSLNLFVPLFFGGHWRPDFTFMWAGARAPDPYDIWAVTKAQAFMFDASKPLAFVYPPSSLPLFYPFGLLPFWTAYVLWGLLSAALFWSAARQITEQAWLVFLAPPVLFCLYLGQTSLVTGAAIIFAVIHLPKRPLMAGVCLGLAAALKPQTVFLAPLALLAGRHWKALGSAGLTWLLFAASTIQLWPDWLRVVQVFPTILDRYYPKIGNGGATPVAFARALGLSTTPLQIAGMALGAMVVWLAFRQDDKRIRIIGLTSGTLLAAPYAMGYEVAAMVPAYLALLRGGRLRSGLVALPMLCMTALTIVPALIVSVGAALLPRYNAAKSIAALASNSGSSASQATTTAATARAEIAASAIAAEQARAGRGRMARSTA